MNKTLTQKLQFETPGNQLSANKKMKASEYDKSILKDQLLDDSKLMRRHTVTYNK